MSSTLTELLKDPYLYLILGGAGGLILLAARQFVRSIVGHQFAKKLESHRAELEMAADRARFDLQHRLAGGGLYLQSQHEAATAIYQAVRIAHGAVGSLFGAQHGYNFDDCNEEDLRDILEQFEVLKGKQDDLIEAWKGNKKKGQEAISDHLRELKLPTADNKLGAKRNQMYLNEIYFSDQAIQAFDAFVAECNKWIGRRRSPPVPGEKVKMVSRDDLNASLDRVQEILRHELSDPPGLGKQGPGHGIAVVPAP